jgi:hypothetical protein
MQQVKICSTKFSLKMNVCKLVRLKLLRKSKNGHRQANIIHTIINVYLCIAVLLIELDLNLELFLSNMLTAYFCSGTHWRSHHFCYASHIMPQLKLKHCCNNNF